MLRKINVGKRILSANEEYAVENSRLLAAHKVMCFNMISSPGSGKTTILARTITELKHRLRIGVIEGDIKTDIDAVKIRETNAPAVQIETGGACHLSAAQVAGALVNLPIRDLDVVFIENVGNLVCPSAFQLGENAKVVVLSVAEGDDKPAKYPGSFANAGVLIINKIDLLEVPGLLDFDIERVKADALNLNRNIRIFPLSARTGAGFGQWCDWLAESVSRGK
jgi:hydrogenase nickel incorporation protein HypB